MSYCVNCGVELEKSEKRCPLCSTEVMNPNSPYNSSLPRPYPRALDRINHKIDRRFSILIVSIIMIFIAIVCLIANLMYSFALEWSLYVVSALILCWVIAVLPFWFTSKTAGVLVALDITALLAFFYIVELLSRGNWFLSLALPIMIWLSLLTVAVWRLTYKKVLTGLFIGSAVSSAAGLFTAGLEVIIGFNVGRGFMLTWSLFVLLPCVALALVLAAIQRNKQLKEALEKRLHI